MSEWSNVMARSNAMDIETPEEFAQQVEKTIVHQYQQSPNGRGGLIMISKDYIPAGKLIAARDAAIRAECAERFVKAYRKDRISDETPAETEALRYYCAAIMAEPEEGV